MTCPDALHWAARQTVWSLLSPKQKECSDLSEMARTLIGAECLAGAELGVELILFSE